MGKEGPSVMGFLDLDSIGPARQACRLFRDVPLERYVAQVIYSKHAMHTYMHLRHSGTHATGSARVRRGSCIAPLKSGVCAGTGEADQGHGVGLWATGTPQDTHGDA